MNSPIGRLWLIPAAAATDRSIKHVDQTAVAHDSGEFVGAIHRFYKATDFERVASMKGQK
jgi:hypothetical protein